MQTISRHIKQFPGISFFILILQNRGLHWFSVAENQTAANRRPQQPRWQLRLGQCRVRRRRQGRQQRSTRIKEPGRPDSAGVTDHEQRRIAIHSQQNLTNREIEQRIVAINALQEAFLNRLCPELTACYQAGFTSGDIAFFVGNWVVGHGTTKARKLKKQPGQPGQPGPSGPIGVQDYKKPPPDHPWREYVNKPQRGSGNDQEASGSQER